MSKLKVTTNNNPLLFAATSGVHVWTFSHSVEKRSYLSPQGVSQGGGKRATRVWVRYLQPGSSSRMSAGAWWASLRFIQAPFTLQSRRWWRNTKAERKKLLKDIKKYPTSLALICLNLQMWNFVKPLTSVWTAEGIIKDDYWHSIQWLCTCEVTSSHSYLKLFMPLSYTLLFLLAFIIQLYCWNRCSLYCSSLQKH